MAFILFLNIAAVSYFSGIPAAPSDVCQSQNCNDLATELLSGMNQTINPCTDFYQYVCGNWRKNHPAPMYTRVWNYFGIASGRINNRVQEILEEGCIDCANTSLRKAIQLYEACMDINTIEIEGVRGIINYMNITGGWPIIMSPIEWNMTRKSWKIVDSEYNVIMGTSPIFKLSVGPNPKSSDENILKIAPPSTDVPIPNSANLDNFFTEPPISNYMEFIKGIARLMARKIEFVIDENQLEEDAQGIVIFESYLRAIAQAAIADHTVTVTIEEFQESWNSSAPTKPTGRINWLKQIRKLFAQSHSVTINSSTPLIVHGENYFKLLSPLLNRTAERDIVNTIQWWFVKQTLSYTNNETVQILEKYKTDSSLGAAHQPPSPPRSLKCVVENELQDALGFAYVRKYFSEDTKATILKMVNETEIEMKNEITRSEWLDDNLKKAAKEKLTSMAKLIGYPDDWHEDPTALDEHYKNLSIGSVYLENMLLFKRFTLQQELESLTKPVDKRTWITSPIDVNAFYTPTANSITFSAAILQMPFFDESYPDAVNYGATGSSIGHELSHAFDTNCIKYDKNGKEVQWLSNETILEHRRKSECFLDQFYRYGALNLTLNENIVDSTGLEAAFKAFKTKITQPGYKHIKLPGLQNLTSEKLFFVSFASSMCENVKPEYLSSVLRESTHSRSSQRVIGSLSNSEDFSETFQCPEGSPMNPPKKCHIWE